MEFKAPWYASCMEEWWTYGLTTYFTSSSPPASTCFLAIWGANACEMFLKMCRFALSYNVGTILDNNNDISKNIVVSSADDAHAPPQSASANRSKSRTSLNRPSTSIPETGRAP